MHVPWTLKPVPYSLSFAQCSSFSCSWVRMCRRCPCVGRQWACYRGQARRPSCEGHSTLRADAACAGFALLETGSSPRRHALNVFSKNVLDMLLNALWFWALGYAFGFGKDVGGVLGTSNFFLEDTPASLHWFEQWVFATNASTIFGGCIAGRAKFAAYMVIASVTSAWTYPVVAHWVWHADGWLATMGQNGVLDFSGSGVVHLTGGVIGLVVRVCRLCLCPCVRVSSSLAFLAALVQACVMIGPRHGYFQDNQDNNQAYNSRRWGPHSMLMAMTGVGLLWVGWYGFNVAPAVLVADEYFVLVSGRVVRDAMCHALSGGGLHRSSCACVCVCVCVCVRARARARARAHL